ncbi:hypothetical protein ACFFIS_04685 [Virgibacillus soli]|uniref:hypothetical protein n=1 Tax=Paracerasibacillus soli TaxID=480284 RepID=UPI0035EC4EF2
MEKAIRRIFQSSGFYFLMGLLLLIISYNGEQIAVRISKPIGESSWSTSGNLIDSFTYIPLIIGIFCFILSIITFSLSMYHTKKKG